MSRRPASRGVLFPAFQIHLQTAEFGNNRDLIQPDGLHPTPAGHEVIAMEFFEAL